MEKFRYQTIFIGVVLAIFLWLFDAFIDVHFFEESESYFQSVLYPGSMELWMRILVSVLIIVFSVYANNLISKLETFAAHDYLTNIYNRRVLHQFLRYEINHSKRHHTPLSLIMLDVDCFKKINDKWGHHEGDKVLKKICLIINKHIRKTDIFARWAGDEFMILSSDTGPESVMILAEKIRASIEGAYADHKFPVTLSLGVTQLDKLDSEETLIARVDKALYLAKERGRNRSIIL